MDHCENFTIDKSVDKEKLIKTNDVCNLSSVVLELICFWIMNIRKVENFDTMIAATQTTPL